MRYSLNPCPLIVITGGENGGKSSCLKRLLEACLKAGFTPIFLPEVATHLFSTGINFRDKRIDPIQFQRYMMQHSVAMEELAKDAARDMIKNGLKPIIFCDRGIADAKIFIDDRAYHKLLKELGLTHDILLQKRYDAVFFMVTAANGAEHAYKQNEFRIQTAAEARQNDKALQDAWNGNLHLRIIPNTGTWDEKLDHLERELFSFLGLPIPIERERKFLVPVSVIEILKNHTKYHSVLIEQRYISGGATGKRRIRRIMSNNGKLDIAFFITKKEATDDPEARIEVSQRISKERYSANAEFQLPNYRTILKRRHYFLYKNQYFELDHFIEPHHVELPNHHEVPNGEQVAMLEIEFTEQGQEIIIPDWIPWCVDVTDDERFYNSFIARLTKA